eukprot:scaffold1_cov108-Cylindrotheca_fusiformis.AAC.9
MNNCKRRAAPRVSPDLFGPADSTTSLQDSFFMEDCQSPIPLTQQSFVLEEDDTFEFFLHCNNSTTSSGPDTSRCSEITMDSFPTNDDSGGDDDKEEGVVSHAQEEDRPQHLSRIAFSMDEENYTFITIASKASASSSSVYTEVDLNDDEPPARLFPTPSSWGGCSSLCISNCNDVNNNNNTATTCALSRGPMDANRKTTATTTSLSSYYSSLRNRSDTYHQTPIQSKKGGDGDGDGDDEEEDDNNTATPTSIGQMMKNLMIRESPMIVESSTTRILPSFEEVMVMDSKENVAPATGRESAILRADDDLEDCFSIDLDNSVPDNSDTLNSTITNHWNNNNYAKSTSRPKRLLSMVEQARARRDQSLSKLRGLEKHLHGRAPFAPSSSSSSNNNNNTNPSSSSPSSNNSSCNPTKKRSFGFFRHHGALSERMVKMEEKRRRLSGVVHSYCNGTTTHLPKENAK